MAVDVIFGPQPSSHTRTNRFPDEAADVWTHSDPSGAGPIGYGTNASPVSAYTSTKDRAGPGQNSRRFYREFSPSLSSRRIGPTLGLAGCRFKGGTLSGRLLRTIAFPTHSSGPPIDQGPFFLAYDAQLVIVSRPGGPAEDCQRPEWSIIG